MSESAAFKPGQRVSHAEHGEGVVVDSERNGYVRVFFTGGERLVAVSSLQPFLSRTDRVISSVAGGDDRRREAWLEYEAHALPLMESAAALTAAPIDLLPHQVVLTHRIATASPRRYLVADEVGLGKTIEAALLLRELASRGELNRALMVVPAGLVNNWHREMNEVFRLDFEVFGSEGDVTDRKSNAFAKHDRLIASIDTLKRPARIKRLLDAPPWDLVVFDEAHHLTAFRNGRKVTKTENYKLAEALKGHARDLVLLSATPHQGDHFRFWMLIQLLNPTLFKSPEDMVENRHRLNAVVFRRTKADACRPDGSPLFARRWVHTESFTMVPEERTFYAALKEYLEDGFALAQRQGNQGRALGFVMTIFQKIAASSFAAVRRTLRRRMLMLTVHEAILKDQELNIDARDQLLAEARELIHDDFEVTRDSVGRGQVDAILADLRVKLLKKLNEEELELASDSSAGEFASSGGEDMAVMAVSLALPEERLRIRELLRVFPERRETKVEKLLRGLGALWEQDPKEKVVIFATYLGTVALLDREIEESVPRPRGRRSPRRRPRSQAGCGAEVQEGRWPARDGLHGGRARGHQPAVRTHLVQLRPAVEPDGHRAAHRAHPSIRAAAYRAGLQPRPLRHDRREDLPTARREAAGDCEDARQGRRARQRRGGPARPGARPALRAAHLRQALSRSARRSRAAPNEGGA